MEARYHKCSHLLHVESLELDLDSVAPSRETADAFYVWRQHYFVIFSGEDPSIGLYYQYRVRKGDKAVTVRYSLPGPPHPPHGTHFGPHPVPALPTERCPAGQGQSLARMQGTGECRRILQVRDCNSVHLRWQCWRTTLSPGRFVHLSSSQLALATFQARNPPWPPSTMQDILEQQGRFRFTLEFRDKQR